MLIIGERINSTRKSINIAIEKKDVSFIQQEAINQVNSGANMLDINCGTDVHNEKDNMQWLIKTVQQVVDVGLVIDSANPEVLSSALKIYSGKKTMINSITGEKSRMESILPIVKEYQTDVVALTMDESGLPDTSQKRIDIAKKIAENITKYSIPIENVYFDLLVRSASTEPQQTKEFLDAIKLIKKELSSAKTICGLSNISFGLPNRNLINSFFFAISIYCGIDAVMIDPLQKQMISSLLATEAILGMDEYCLNYITAYRENKI